MCCAVTPCWCNVCGRRFETPSSPGHSRGRSVQAPPSLCPATSQRQASSTAGNKPNSDESHRATLCPPANTANQTPASSNLRAGAASRAALRSPPRGLACSLFYTRTPPPLGLGPAPPPQSPGPSPPPGRRHHRRASATRVLTRVVGFMGRDSSRHTRDYASHHPLLLLVLGILEFNAATTAQGRRPHSTKQHQRSIVRHLFFYKRIVRASTTLFADSARTDRTGFLGGFAPPPLNRHHHLREPPQPLLLGPLLALLGSSVREAGEPPERSNPYLNPRVGTTTSNPCPRVLR